MYVSLCKAKEGKKVAGGMEGYRLSERTSVPEVGCHGFNQDERRWDDGEGCPVGVFFTGIRQHALSASCVDTRRRRCFATRRFGRPRSPPCCAPRVAVGGTRSCQAGTGDVIMAGGKIDEAAEKAVVAFARWTGRLACG